MNMIFYTKTGCPWCIEMKEYFDQKGISYEERNVIDNPEYFKEMKEISGQEKAPTLNIDGKIIADADISDVEPYLK